MNFKKSQSHFFLVFLLLFSLALLFNVSPVYSEEFDSTNFKVLEPVMQPAGYATSTSFGLWSTISEMAIGTSTSANRGINSGFLYFPFASSPIVSATAGNGQATLSWTVSTGLLGWNVSGYDVGRSTVSGGPYTYSASLGNVTNSTRTGLTNNTTYYFVVRAEDTFGNPVATSSEVSVVPVAPIETCGNGSCGGGETCSTCPADCGNCPGGGGGGGGGGIFNPSTRVILKGRAYPNAAITIFKDGSVAATPKADINANFQEELPVGGGIYTFSVYAIDSENRRSLTSSFTANVPSGLTTTISDIVIAPTIGADKAEVKIGNEIKFFGYSFPQSQVSVIINSETMITDQANSDKLGYWSYNLESELLEKGDHTTKSQTVTPDTLKSPFSESLAFRVGDKDVLFGKLPSVPPIVAGPTCNKNGDINNDKRVNIVDFSIMLYFWNQQNPKNPCADINKDGVVNLFDFSIMLFWWTG